MPMLMLTAIRRIMIFPGMAARVLFPDEVACADPDECMRICSAE